MGIEGNTRERILDIVEALIMERGFNAMSYQDVSERIGIRKASVHYHFPTKGDLGAAVIRRYASKVAQVTVPLDDCAEKDLRPAFEAFLKLFVDVASNPSQVCLGGVLGAEFQTLPEIMQTALREFFNSVQNWLAALLDQGRTAGVFAFGGDSLDHSRAIFSAMQGALILGRALGRGAHMKAAAQAARACVGIA